MITSNEHCEHRQHLFQKRRIDAGLLGDAWPATERLTSFDPKIWPSTSLPFSTGVGSGDNTLSSRPPPPKLAEQFHPDRQDRSGCA
jgi:hypothetical protein